LCVASCWAVPQAARDNDETVRPPAVAGRFYPADATTLRRAVDTLVRQARPVRTGDAVAVVAPHAGFVYSGQIAADALDGPPEQRVVRSKLLAHDQDLVPLAGTRLVA